MVHYCTGMRFRLLYLSTLKYHYYNNGVRRHVCGIVAYFPYILAALIAKCTVLQLITYKQAGLLDNEDDDKTQSM